MVETPFLHINLIDDYKNSTNDIEISEQIKNVYQWDIFMWNQK